MAGKSSIPALPTLSFHGASYTSKYLTFTPVEAEDRAGKPLDTPTKDQTPEQVAGVVGNPSDQLGASVLSSANTLTASIYDVTGDHPANVCSSSTIQAVKGKLLAKGK